MINSRKARRWRLRMLGLAGGAGIALAVAMTGSAAGEAVGPVVASGPLSDLQPATVNPTDQAQATVVGVSNGRSTTFYLVVTGLDPASAGQTFGAHIHVGPCVAGNGAAAGPHYNTTGGAVVSPQTEVWLDFTVLPGGVAFSQTTVPFLIPAGAANSLVVHQNPTQPNGAAGPRIACLPVDFGSGPDGA